MKWQVCGEGKYFCAEQTVEQLVPIERTDGCGNLYVLLVNNLFIVQDKDNLLSCNASRLVPFANYYTSLLEFMK